MKRVFTVIAMFLLMPALVFAGSLSGDGKNIRSAGLKYLANNQNDDGSYGETDKVDITTVVIYAMAASGRKYLYNHGPFVSRAVDYLLSQQKEDGSFGTSLTTYNAVAALKAANIPPQFLPKITKAEEWLNKHAAKIKAESYFGLKIYGYTEFPFCNDIITAFNEKNEKKAADVISIILNMQDRTDMSPKMFGKIAPKGSTINRGPAFTTAVYVIAADRFSENAKSFK